ncbi:MAG: hypothetical protein Q9160_008406 [Pyrenula sp. 1 TL-2023]
MAAFFKWGMTLGDFWMGMPFLVSFARQMIIYNDLLAQSTPDRSPENTLEQKAERDFGHAGNNASKNVMELMSSNAASQELSI